MVEFLKRSWAVIDLDNIAHNTKEITKRLTPGCQLMGVVKADAYGHGDKYIAEQLVQMGVTWFGVSNIDEALSLRWQGITQPILILGATPPEYAEVLEREKITQTVYSMESAALLQKAAAAAGVKVDIHIKVDTGMSRLGFLMAEGFAHYAVEEIEAIVNQPNLHASGIFTHFACADEPEPDSVSYTRLQYSRFCGLLDTLEKRGVTFTLRHCCNSAATLNYPEMHMDMVRLGILLYGLSPSPMCCDKIDLRPAMELYSCVSMVKEIPCGTPVSYGRCYTAHRDMRVATVSIGYADGYERELSNKARMLVRGQYANVIGRVCMDQLMLDVTHIDGVCAGDIVTIVGTSGNRTLSFDEMARLTGTINYEKVTLLGKRVPRVYRQDGQTVGIVDYVRRHM